MAQQAESGTQTAVIDTEHFLGTDPDTTEAVFQYVVDLSEMVRGDRVEIRVYEKPTSASDTALEVAMWPFLNEQTSPLFMSPALIMLWGHRFSLTQTDGTGRDFKWSKRVP